MISKTRKKRSHKIANFSGGSDKTESVYPLAVRWIYFITLTSCLENGDPLNEAAVGNLFDAFGPQVLLIGRNKSV
jgi:hypothetical protein